MKPSAQCREYQYNEEALRSAIAAEARIVARLLQLNTAERSSDGQADDPGTTDDQYIGAPHLQLLVLPKAPCISLPLCISSYRIVCVKLRQWRECNVCESCGRSTSMRAGLKSYSDWSRQCSTSPAVKWQIASIKLTNKRTKDSLNIRKTVL